LRIFITKSFKTRERIPALDGLRGLAVLLVLVWHFVFAVIPADPGSTWGYVSKLGHHSYSGVDLFFVLSGFLITSILLKELGTQGWLARFWIRRTFRIFPLYALFLSTACVIHFFRDGQSSGFFSIPRYVWPYLCMLQNFEMAWVNNLGPWGITWSLAIEEQFYFVFPAFLWLTYARNWLPFWSLIAILTSLGLRLHGEYLYSFVLTPYRLDGLAAGAACAWILKCSSSTQWLASRPNLVRTLTLIGILLILLISVRRLDRHPIDHTVFAFAYSALLVHVVVRTGGIMEWFFQLRPLTWLGAISYPLYLFHEIVGWALNIAFEKTITVNPWLFAFFAFTTSLILADILNKWIGEPAVSYGKNLMSLHYASKNRQETS
jgi:peptidoglycan/LPS O-acetylase OafA/YrhL